MGNKWTKEQLNAITKKGCNLLVAAAAGAGKTAVLVERIIKKITDSKDPVDIDRLLVVTFTNAAATEMKSRIAEAISASLEKYPGSRVLQRQLTLLNKSSITTIHSFCLDVIKNNFEMIDLDPDFRIADQTEGLLMKTEVLEELFNDIYDRTEEDDTFFKLLESYSGNRDDKVLQKMVLDIFEFIQSHPWPDEWIEKHAGQFNLCKGSDFADTVWGKVLIENIIVELNGLKSIMEGAIELINGTEGLESYIPVFMEDKKNIEMVLNSCKEDIADKWDIVYNIFSGFEFSRLKRCGKDVDEAVKESVILARDDMKKRIKKISDDIFAFDSDGIRNELQSLYPLIVCLGDLVKEFKERYDKKKRSKSLVDFNDLEHFCLHVLTVRDENGVVYPSEVAVLLKKKFEEVMVDEYQDSNFIQEIILKTVSRAEEETPNMFMVGDVKQSIYRFRQAKPDLFLEKYNNYSSLEGDKNLKIKLFKNFRSRIGVVDSVNFIFRQIMSEAVGELDYNDEEALNAGAVFEPLDKEDSYARGCTELHIIDLKDEYGADNAYVGPGEQEDRPDFIQCEAKVVADRIKKLVNTDSEGKVFRIFDKGNNKYRPLEYRDIVILLRSTKNLADVFMDEMTIHGIPAYADIGTGFFKTIEVKIMLSLLQIIDNPLQDIPLLAVLRSPIASFTPDDLIDLRLTDRKSCIYIALKKLANNNTETSKKAAGFLTKLDKWRDKAIYMSTDRLIWYLYDDTGYYAFAGAMPGGRQRQANLKILFERARQFEESSYKGLFNFINFVDKLIASRGDMGSARILGENENVVRIMSIHKSKGLEFPVVILSGCGKRFNLQDMNDKILLHQDIGFGPDFVDYKKRITYPSIAKYALKYKIKVESLSEEMRILYVALTRAREKLIMTGVVKDLKKACNRWSKCLKLDKIKLPEYEMLRSESYIDWMAFALIRHESSKNLRSWAGINGRNNYSRIDDPSKWKIEIWNKSSIILNISKNKSIEKESIKRLEEKDIKKPFTKYSDEIERRLNWEYAYKKAASIPTKLSVTELKKRFSLDNQDEYMPFTLYAPRLVKKPMFLEENKGLDAAEKGTILHFVMQHVELKNVGTYEEIENEINKMKENDLLTKQQAETVEIKKIENFFKSVLGQKMLNAERVNREIPFNYKIKSTDFYKDLEREKYEYDTMLLQGVIDCYIEEPDGILLIDYKTDYVPEGKTDRLREKYKIQIDCYSMALEKLTGKKVKGKYIYSFCNEESIAL